MKHLAMKFAIAILALSIFHFQLSIVAEAARLKDIAHVEGSRVNQLNGYGLVIGLEGTGDKQNTEFTVQTLANLLQEYNIRVNPADVRVKNVAAVIVTAEVPAFSQSGSRLDANIASMGDATSLSGGVLLMTPLKGPDGRVYGVAQGPVTLGGGFTALAIGAKVTKNHPTSGRITGGMLLERAIPSGMVTSDGQVRINLDAPDFTTAKRIAEALAQGPLQASAQALSPGLVTVALPESFKNQPVEYIAALESVEIFPDHPARVVVNERTGTVIIGKNVRITPVAVAHAGLYVAVKNEPRVSQPNAFANGRTVVFPDTTLEIKEPESRQLIELPGGPGVMLSELVRALNSLGVTPRDLIAVFEALKESGALQAELVVM
jgi:flagellar P-ring protein precursor FlgI